MPRALRTDTLFFSPRTQGKRLPTQCETLSRLTTTRACTHKRRLRPFAPRKSLSTDEFPQHGERSKQLDRLPKHALSTAFSLSTEPQVSRFSAPRRVMFRISPNPNPNHATMWRRHQVLSATPVAEVATRELVWTGTRRGILWRRSGFVSAHVTSVKSSPTHATQIGQVCKKITQSGKCSL